MISPLVCGLAACSDPGPWHASHTGIVGSERLATCRPRACRVCVKCSTSSLWQAMQDFSPTARASGAPGFDATCAFAKPGAGRGRSPRSTVRSEERFVDGATWQHRQAQPGIGRPPMCTRGRAADRSRNGALYPNLLELLSPTSLPQGPANFEKCALSAHKRKPSTQSSFIQQ